MSPKLVNVAVELSLVVAEVMFAALVFASACHSSCSVFSFRTQLRGNVVGICAIVQKKMSWMVPGLLSLLLDVKKFNAELTAGISFLRWQGLGDPPGNNPCLL